MGTKYTKPITGRIEAAGNKLKAGAESSWNDISDAWGGVTAKFDSSGLGAAAKYAGSSAWGAMGAKSYSAIGGAGLGGAYGAYSDDTSITGGAFMGAGLGVGALVGGRAASEWWGNRGKRSYNYGKVNASGDIDMSKVKNGAPSGVGGTGGSMPYSNGSKYNYSPSAGNSSYNSSYKEQNSGFG